MSTKVNWVAVTAIATLILAAPFIYSWFKAPDYAVEAQGEYWSSSLPASVFDDAEKLKSAAEPEIVGKKIDEILADGKPGLSPAERHELAIGLGRYMRDIAYGSEASKFKNMRGRAELEVKNVGNREIDNIRLALPLN